jgi:hypothetical protein
LIWQGKMAQDAQDIVTLVRIADHCGQLTELRRFGDDEAIDREFNAVCRSIWGYACDDFDDDAFDGKDHRWLDGLTEKRAITFAIENGYDLYDYAQGRIVTDWWGFAWMILAQKRELLTPEHRAAAWRKYDARLMEETNVVGVIRWR